MPKPTIDEIVDNYKTYCCQANYERKGQHDYFCTGCNTDVTQDFYVNVSLQID